MFARIGDVLPRFRTYEKLFSNYERLIEALSIAYLDIITFCSDAKAVFRSRSSYCLDVLVAHRAKHNKRIRCLDTFYLPTPIHLRL